MNSSPSPSPQERLLAWAAGSAVAALSVLSAVFIALHDADAGVPPAGAPPLPLVSIATVVDGELGAWNEVFARLGAVEHARSRGPNPVAGAGVRGET